MTRQTMVISGKVAGVSGDPIVGARVCLIDGPVALPDIAALTNDQGAFSLSAPAAGGYRLKCFADDLRPVEVDVVVEQGFNQEINIQLI